MVLILAWLLAKQKHLDVYSQLYLNQGFDVLIAHISPWQFFWPTNGSQVGVFNCYWKFYDKKIH